MPKVTFIFADGNSKDVEAPAGTSLMKAALDNGISGIDAECGGCLTCATCHCYIEEPWSDRVPAASDDENTMVECAIDVQSNSRLSCQVLLTDALDGIQVRIPRSQT